MRGTKIFFAVWSVVLVLAIGVGLMTRFSFAQDIEVGKHMEQPDQYTVNLSDDEEFTGIYFDNEMKDLTQLKERSALIVKVKVSNERLNYMRAILSGVDVLDVYKGNVKKGDRIYVYEPSNFYLESYFVEEGYNVMQDGQEYILFLKHLPIPDGYKYKGKEAISFLPVSTLYAKYPLSSKNETKVLDRQKLLYSDEGVSYASVQTYDILTTEPKKLKQYEAFREHVLQMDK